MKAIMFTTMVVTFLIGVIACGVTPSTSEQPELPASPTPPPQPGPAESGGQDMIVTPAASVSSVTPTVVDLGPPVDSGTETREAGEMIVYPAEYVAYQYYLDVIGGKPGRADTGVIEATVLSINTSEVCPYQEEICSIEPYPSDWGVVRVDNVVSYSPFGGQVSGAVEEPGEAEPPPGGRTTSGNTGSGQQPEKAKYAPLRTGEEVQTLFLLTTRPAKVRSAPIAGAQAAEPARPPEGDAQTTIGRQIQPGEAVFKPIPREGDHFVFYPKLTDSSSAGETVLPGLEIGSRFRAEIRFNGTLYVEEYEVLPQ